MADSPSVFMPAFGKVIELGQLDDFVWATLHGWGSLPARKLIRKIVPLKSDETDPEGAAKRLAEGLKEDEEHLRLLKFTGDQADKDYPYLFSLVAVRLWAMVEAAARELVVEGIKQPVPLPKPAALAKLKGPIAPFIGADASLQTELAADALWHSVEGQFSGVERFDAVLDRLGFSGVPHATVHEILTELSEVRHCVVHRDGFADRRLLAACPWLGMNVGERLPATIERYWFYRTATYAYVMDLLRRWSRWRKIPQFVEIADQMEAAVLSELTPGWTEAKRFP
jgi:hypothetical protein